VPTSIGRVAECSQHGPAAAPTILVVGAVHHLECLRVLGHTQRARWDLLAPRAAGSPADLIVVGQASAGVQAGAVIAELKDDPSTSAIPVLHAAPAEDACPECRADVCLSTGSTPGQLARVAGALLELARARARSSGLYAARASLAAGAASRPAP
jgi:hypothetical protein